MNKQNLIIIAFSKTHLFEGRFIKQWKKRFPVMVVDPNNAEHHIKVARGEFDHVTLITDMLHSPGTPHDRIVLDRKGIIFEDSFVALWLYTFVLTDHIFYEMLSWLIECRFPDKIDLI